MHSEPSRIWPQHLVIPAWTLAALWAYIHAFVFAVNHVARTEASLDGVPFYIFMVATTVGWLGGSSWLLIAGAVGARSIRRGLRPRIHEVIAFAVVALPMSIYLYLVTLD